MSIIIKSLMGMVMKLATEAFLQELVLWIFKQLAESSKTKVDDELYEKVKRHIEGK